MTYAVPILNSLINVTPKIQRCDGIQAIIVVPTRELAMQTHELFTKLNVSVVLISLTDLPIFFTVLPVDYYWSFMWG